MDNNNEKEIETATDAQPETAEAEELALVETERLYAPRRWGAGRMIARILAVLAALAATAVLAVGAGAWMLLHGPSGEAAEQTLFGMKSTPLGRAVLCIAMTDEEIKTIEEARADRETVENASLGALAVTVNPPIEFPSEDTDKEEDKEGENEQPSVPPEDDDGIELVHIKSESYQGTLLIVDDPKRIFVGVPDRFGGNVYGLTLRNMIRKYDAVGGINAGGFEVIGDIQMGGVPMGFVIKDSKVAWGDGNLSKNICGFDADGKLVVGTMTPNQAIARGVVDAVSFGPALLVDGQPVNTGHWLGVQRNARTAIGQREDGTILLLVIEGRHIASFGAYFTEVIDIFLEYGAVNATNLDGGYSTFMVYEDGGLDMHSYAYGERFLPTSILIKKK